MESVDEIVGFEEPQGDADRRSYEAIGAALDVHSALRPGHPESAYEEALCVELTRRGIPFERQFRYAITYKGVEVGHGRVDLLIGGVLVVQVKSCEQLAPVHTSQVISYMRATGTRLAPLINFNVRRLKDGIKRVALT